LPGVTACKFTFRNGADCQMHGDPTNLIAADEYDCSSGTYAVDGPAMNHAMPSWKGASVNEDESLRRYGLHPAGGDLDQVRECWGRRLRANGKPRVTEIPS
jgi:hypothetical protein